MLNFKERTLTSIIFSIVIILLFLDLVEDYNEGVEFAHLLKESIVMIVAMLGFIFLWFRLLFAKVNNKKHLSDINRLKQDLEFYKTKTQNLTLGLSDIINQQLNIWNLTTSEKDVALLLLKGLSLKEISDIRSTTEKTIKQHSSNLYSKANLSGRAELSAFFLEDLLVLK